MSYERDGAIADLFPEDFVDRAAERMTEAVGGHLVGDVAKRTPVAKVPEAYGKSKDEWITDRGGRIPGTAKRGWYAAPVEVIPGKKATVDVDSKDYPVIIWIEYDTVPHRIYPKKAKALRFPDGPTFRYAGVVNHPGTTGQHMMRDAEAALEAGWRRPASVALDRQIAQANDL